METRAVIIIAFEGFQSLDVAGPHQMFAGANEDSGREVYRLSVVAPQPGTLRSSGGLSLAIDGVLDAGVLREADTVIVSGGGEDGMQASLDQGLIARALIEAAPHVRRIASVCSGAFFLAQAGLLDGRRAVTHWSAIDRLRRYRPAILVEPDAIQIKDGNVWTSGGVTAGIDLALAMVEEDLGASIALSVARRHLVQRIRSGGQSQYAAALPGHGDPALARLSVAVTDAPGLDWSVEKVASFLGLEPRTLSRHFARHGTDGPAAFVERLRVEIARDALVATSNSIERIADASGFGSARRMHRAFERLLGASPTAFRDRFQSRSRSAPP
jgi:transcriptional regulator GlxA family with amidase domain